MINNTWKTKDNSRFCAYKAAYPKRQAWHLIKVSESQSSKTPSTAAFIPLLQETETWDAAGPYVNADMADLKKIS